MFCHGFSKFITINFFMFFLPKLMAVIVRRPFTALRKALTPLRQSAVSPGSEQSIVNKQFINYFCA